MLTTTLPYAVDLSRPLQMTPLRTALITGDHEAHAFELSVSRGGTPVDLSRAAAYGYFLRGDGTTVLVDGTTQDATATVILPEDCYVAEGRFSLVVQLLLDGVRHSVLWIEGTVNRSRSDLVASDTFPDLEQLLSRIHDMQIATEDALAAAEAARGLINDKVAAPDSTWSSLKLAHELCPEMIKSGELIVCRPAPFLPLDVKGSATTLVRTGKNLVRILNGFYESITYTFPVPLPQGVYTLSILNATAAVTARVTYVDGTTQDVPVAAGAAASLVNLVKRAASISLIGAATYTNVQLEKGEQANPFETYNANIVPFSDGLAKVDALEGVNCLWADAAITVQGLASPAAAFGELAERGPIPLATTESPGAVKVGAGLRVTSDGTLSATGVGGVADSVAWEDIIDKPAYFNPAPHSHPEAAGGGSANVEELLLRMYPVGCIYQSTQATDPGTLFGGTWQQINDRFLLAAGSYGAGSTGGAATVTLTTTQVPQVAGELQFHSADNGTVLNTATGCFKSTLDNANYFRGGGERDEGNVSVGRVYFDNGGLGAAHENMPPYLAVYTWTRVA